MHTPIRRRAALAAASTAALFLCALVLLLPQPAAADVVTGEFSLEVSVAEEQVDVGETFVARVGVYHDGTQPYQAVQWNLRYAPAPVTVLSMTPAAGVPPECNLKNNNGSRVLLGCFSLGGPTLTYSGDVWDVTFQCEGDGYVDLSLVPATTFAAPGTEHYPGHLHHDNLLCGAGGPPPPTPTPTPIPGPPNDDSSYAAFIGRLPFEDVNETSRATLELNESNSCAPSIGRTLWYRYRSPVDRQLVITSEGSDFDTAIGVYTFGGFSPPAGFNQIACNDDGFGVGSQSRLDIEILAGASYYIQIGGVDGAAGTARLSITGEPPDGAIAGRVTDNNGAPIAGAIVAAQSQDCCYEDAVGFSDSQGFYRIESVSPASHRVVAVASGFVAEYYDDTYDYFSAALVDVPAGATVSGIDFTLTRSGSITGVVTDEEGAPLRNATVFAMTNACCGSSGFAFTDNAGRYRLDGLTPGDYIVRADANGYAVEYHENVSSVEEATLVPVTEGSTTEISFALSRGLVISGKITGEEGEFIGTPWVFAERTTCCSGGYYSVTRPDGTYSIYDMAPGDYIVWAEASFYVREFYDNVYRQEDATPVTLATESVDGIDFELSRGGSISGVVRQEDGTGLPNPDVWAEAIECCWSAYTYGDAIGAYTIATLPPGDYIITAGRFGYVTEYYDGVRDSANATIVSVEKDEAVTGIDFILAPPNPDFVGDATIIDTLPYRDERSTLKGTREEGEPEPCGNIRSTFWYRLDVPTSPPVNEAITVDTAGSDFDTVVAVYTSDSAFDSPPGGLELLGCNATSAEGPAAVTFEAQSSRSYWIQLGGILGQSGDAVLEVYCAGDRQCAGTGSISGTVLDDEGQPIEGAFVSVERDPCCDFGFAGADELGRYTIANLSPGTYRVNASAFPFIGEFYDGTTEYDLATLVTVTDGGITSGIDFELARPDPDLIENAIEISPVPFADTHDTAGATLSEGEPQPCGDIGATVWYRVEMTASPPLDVDLVVSTAGSDFDTVLAVYALDYEIPSPPGGLDPIVCNDDAEAGVTASSVTFRAAESNVYYVQAGGKGGAQGELHLSVTCDGDPECDDVPPVPPTPTGTPPTATPSATPRVVPPDTGPGPTATPIPTQTRPGGGIGGPGPVSQTPLPALTSTPAATYTAEPTHTPAPEPTATDVPTSIPEATTTESASSPTPGETTSPDDDTPTPGTTAPADTPTAAADSPTAPVAATETPTPSPSATSATDATVTVTPTATATSNTAANASPTVTGTPTRTSTPTPTRTSTSSTSRSATPTTAQSTRTQPAGASTQPAQGVTPQSTVLGISVRPPGDDGTGGAAGAQSRPSRLPSTGEGDTPESAGTVLAAVAGMLAVAMAATALHRIRRM